MTVLQELRRIEAAHDGLLRPEDVVAFAVNPQTALHPHFEWDDAKAAYSFRLWQARQIITAQVTIIGRGSEARKVQAYVSLMTDRVEPGGGYRPITRVLTDKDLHAQLLAEAYAELEVFRRKYQYLSELSELFGVIDQVIPKRRRARG